MIRKIPYLVLLGSTLITLVAQGREIIVQPPAQCTKSSPGVTLAPVCGLKAALQQLRPGDTLRLRPGIYRQPLDLRRAVGYSRARAIGSRAPPTRIEGPVRGSAIVSGARRVIGWKPLDRGVWVRPGWKINSQQGFVDGKPLIQVGGLIWGGYPGNPASDLARIRVPRGIWPGRIPGNASILRPHQFFYDRSGQRLYLRLPRGQNPNHLQVLFAVHPYLLFASGWDRLTVRRLSFRYSNTSAVSQAGAITLSGNYITLDHLRVEQVDSTGISLAGDHNRIVHTRVIRAGRLGYNVRGRRVYLADDLAAYNNTRGFNKWWEAGGFKFVGNGGLRDSVVTRLRAIGNDGDGIWFDWKNRGDKLTNSLSAYNIGFGIHVEVSHDIRIEGNRVYGNGQRGISLASSRNLRIMGNLVADNGLGGIISLNENRGAATTPQKILVCANLLAWNRGSALTLPLPLAGSMARNNVYLDASGRPHLGLGKKVGLMGLAAWNRRYGQGRGSRAYAVSMPAKLAAILRAKQLIDWRRVLKDVGIASLPPLTAGCRDLPRGPLR